MSKKYLFLFCILLSFYQNANSQLSDLHYLPPLKQVSNNQAILQQAYYLSTPETSPFTVQVFQGVNTTPVATLTVSNANPVQYALGNGDNNVTLVTNSNTGIVLSNSGLHFSSPGGQKFYVNYRGRSAAQATSLTSKGRQALGLNFKWGGIPNRANNANLTTTLGIMATEDNTTVTISGYDPNCEFRLGNDAGGITSNTITITLNAGQSYVVEALKNQIDANIDGWLGASITADKKIAISNGGLNVGVRTGSGSRDAAIDQPVPQNIIGRDYVFVRGNGIDETEFPIIIGTQNGTDIFVNGSTTPIATINNGEYFEIPGSNYSSGSIGANMTVVTSKEAYAYQCLAGASGIQTIGLNFIAPVNCLLPYNLSNIPDIKDVAGLGFDGGITIVASSTTADEDIEVTDDSGIVTKPSSIAATGLPWKTFYIPNLSGNVSVKSTGPIAIGFLGVNSNAGVAGYFSGFDTVPIVDLEITGGGCLPGADIAEISGLFEAYQWYKDGNPISGATSSSFTPVSPGDFYVKVTKGGCSYNSTVISAYNCFPEIVLTKTVDKTNVIEGDTVIFKVSVKSLGINPVTNLVINDLLPPELSFVSATAVHGTWTAPNWNIGTMNSGEVFNIFITAKVNEVSTSSTVLNIVSNTEDIPEADVQVDDDTEPVNITNSEIEVTKVANAAVDGNYDTVGELINYELIVTNTGDTPLTNINITDPKADAGSISPSSVANLAIGASTTFTATHKITQADIETGQVVNQATAKATLSNGFVISDISDDPTNTNTTTNDPTITLIDQKGALVLEKIAQPAPDGFYDAIGEIITYNLRVTNTGNVSLNNITITDPNADIGTIQPVTVATLAVGASATFTAKHTLVTADFTAGKVSNIATVSGTEPVGGALITDGSDDPTTIVPNDATVVSIPQEGILTVTKVDSSPANIIFNTVGQVINYTIFVENTGTILLTDVNIVDPNADTVVLQSTTGTDTNTTDNRVDSLDQDQTATFTATHVITQADLDNGKVINTATAGALDSKGGSVTDVSDDPDNPNNDVDDPTETQMSSVPSLTITKTVDDELNVTQGQDLIYTYIATNTGNVTIENVSINDVHVANGAFATPKIQSTNGTDTDNSDNEVDSLAPGQMITWTTTYTVTATDISSQSDITNTVTATGTPKTGSFTNPTADKIVSVHPIETICSNATLNHNLNSDGPFSSATFSWQAVSNGDVSGESTTAKTTSLINDKLINTSGADQVVQYNIIVKNASNVTIDSYKYLVTVHSQLITPDNESSTVQCLAEATQPTAPVVKDYNKVNIVPVITESTSPTCEGNKSYTFDYTDCGGNISTYTYTYIIDRTIAPATIPTDGASTVECLANATTPNPPTGIKDVCGNDISAVLVSTVDSPTSITCEGSRTYNYTYTDCSGLVSNWKYIYTIDRTIAPATIPTDGASTIECLANTTTPTPPTGIKDVCGNDISAVLVSTVDSPTTITCEGSRTYNYTYTDCSGLVSNWKYIYTIDRTIAPATIPTDGASTVECLTNATTPSPPTGIKDVCGNDITAVLVSTVDSPTTITCEGSRTYNYTYTDCSGLVSNWKYVYTIDRTIAPATIPTDGASTVECLTNATTPTPPTGIKDVCGNDITAVLVSTVDSPSTITCEGTRTYNYTYTDCSGLVSNWKYTYLIDMTINPVVPANTGSTVNDISKAIQPVAPVVTDKCGNNLTPVITENASPVCDGTKIYTFTYTDCAGNSAVYTYTYLIDVTSTLLISNTTRTTCSDVALNFDLKKLTTLANPSFQWIATDNPNVTGENNSSGTLLNDKIINTTGIVQDVKYTVTPFNNKGCQGPNFEIIVSINPEPFVANAPIVATCSNTPLNHDLNTDVNVTGASFKWFAESNPNVSGATTTVSNTSTITDNLINTSGMVQTVVYKITPESTKGCIGKEYNYTVTVQPEAKLIVTKATLAAADGAYDTLGEVIKYEIIIENPNELALTDLTLTDANVDVNSINPQMVPNVAAFTKVTFTASHTITQADLDAGFVDNRATGNAFDPCGTTVTDDSDDPNTAVDNDITRTNLIQKPLIALEKTFVFNDENGDGFVQNNETITYNFKVTNSGNINLTAIQITDPLITVNGGPINLAPGVTDITTFFGTYLMKQNVIDTGTLTNSASVKAIDSKGNLVSDISDDPNDLTNTDSNGNGNPDDSTVFKIVANPELTIKKSGVFIDANGDGLAQAGEKIEYTFDVSNTGNVTMNGITISDPLTAVTGGPIILLPGQTDSNTFTAIYTLLQADVNTGTVTNTATVTGKSPDGSTITDASDDPSTIADNDATVTKLTQDAQIRLLKTAVFKDENGNGFPDVGETIDYIFNVKNIGNVTATDIKITDPLITITAGPITLLPNQSDNSTFIGTYTLSLNDINTGSVVNSATAEGKDPKGNTISALSDDPNNPTNVDTNGDGHPDDKTITKLIANPKLSITKTAVFNDINTDGIAQVGETISYTFEIKNIGNVTVSDIQITDALVTVNGSPITLNPNQNDSTTFSALYTIKQNDIDAGKVTNSAIASGLSPKGNAVSDTSDDPNNSTNQDTNGNGEPDDATVTTIPGKGKISLIKVALAPTDGAYDTVGEVINYQLTIINTGNLTLTNIIVTDANANTGSILPAVITTIAPGATAIVNAKHTLTIADINSGGVTNSASVTSKDPFGNNITDVSDDPNNTINNDTNGDGDPDDATLTLITQKPSLSLEKTDTFNDQNNDGLPQANETITYNFKVINTGNVTLSNIVVTDALVTVNGGPISLQTGQSNSTTFYATYTITQANIDAGTIVNSATVNAKDTKGNNVTDTSDDPTNTTNNDVNGDGEPDDATITSLASNPQLTITKTGTFIDANNDGLAQAGETVKYHFDVTNTGNVTISGITVADPLVTVTGGPITLLPKARNTTTFQAVYVLTQDDVDLGFVINTATASGKDPKGNTISDQSDDPTTASKNDATTTTLARESQLSLFKTATFNDENGDGLPQANETINYKFDIRNNGNVTVFDVRITDPIVSIVGGPIDLSPAQIDDTAFTAVYTIKQSDIDSGAISNSAIAAGEDRDGTAVTDVSDFSDDPDNPNDIDLNGDGDPDDPTVSSLTGKASLDLIKKGTFNDINANGFADINETITYEFEVTNTGNLSINNIVITDPLVTVKGTAINLAPNQKDATTFTAIYTITQADLDAGQIINSATVSGKDPNGNTVKDASDDPTNAANTDSNNDGNPDDATITSFPVQGKISITKTASVAADGAYDTVGEKITYNLVVTNTGSTTLTAITVTDANADTASITPKTITVLAPGQAVNISAVHTITQADLNAGTFSNSASVSSKDKLGNTVSDISDDPTNPANVDINADGDPDDVTVTAITQKPKLALTKTATLSPDGLWDEVGEIILYNLELTNTGNVTLTNVVITDPNADIASVVPANIVKLEPGQTVLITAQHTITQNDLDKGAVTNSAKADAVDPKGNTVSDLSDDPTNPANVDTNGNGNPDDATVTAIPQTAKMDVIKVTNTPRYTNVGDILTYTITVTNTGTVTLLNINIKDVNAIFTSPATKGSLLPKASFSVTAQHIVTADDILFGYIDNTAVTTAIIPFSNIIVTEDSDDPNNPTNLDKDNDGDFEDPTTSYLDTDSDGVADIIDIDDDNDGIIDTLEGNADSDGDGIPNSLDIDADNDGIPDNVEGQPTNTYKAPSGIDANKNGLDDIYETAIAIGIIPVNTDGTDNPDYLDDDSDNDGVTDTIEAFDKNHDGIPDIFLSGNDADHDGLDDSFEGTNIMDGFVVNDELKNGSNDTNNTDQTDQPDYRDTDDDNDGVLTIYEIDPNRDGNGPDDTDKDGIPDYLDTDDDGDGLSTRKEGADPNGDGNPDDAIDANINGIPDYLEVGNHNPNIPDDEIEVFNYVSANPDGKNDAFVLGQIFLYPENTVEIYNRWGVLVYETKGYGTRNNYFRGYSEGRVTISNKDKLPSGTYFYVIKYKSGDNLKQKAGYLFLQN